MSLEEMLDKVVSLIGKDIKGLRERVYATENGTGTLSSTICVVNAATRLIQTQKITAQLISRGQV